MLDILGTTLCLLDIMGLDILGLDILGTTRCNLVAIISREKSVLESREESVPLEGEGFKRLSGTLGQGIQINVSSSLELRAFFLAIKASILCLLPLFLCDLEWALAIGGETEESVFQISTPDHAY